MEIHAGDKDAHTHEKSNESGLKHSHHHTTGHHHSTGHHHTKYHEATHHSMAHHPAEKHVKEQVVAKKELHAEVETPHERRLRRLRSDPMRMLGVPLHEHMKKKGDKRVKHVKKHGHNSEGGEAGDRGSAPQLAFPKPKKHVKKRFRTLAQRKSKH